MPRAGRRSWAALASCALYRATVAAAVPAIAPWLAWHPRLASDLRHRFGFVPRRTDRPVWYHGASAGDLVALQPLVERAREQDVPAAVSCWTRSGHDLGVRRLSRAGEPLFFMPVDLAAAVDRALSRVRPRLLVLECLEIWPALLAACRRRGVPVAVVNGRLSPRSRRSYSLLRPLFGPCFAQLAQVVALSSADAERFAALGTRPSVITVCPSSKHAAIAPGAPSPTGGQRPRIVLGSLHGAEERLLFPHLPRLVEAAPGWELTVVPRYPHRARRTEARLRRLGLGPGRGVSVLGGMGQLAASYCGAAAAFVGGSLVPRGGHNVVEPAARGVPVVTGPFVENCRIEVQSLLHAGAARVVGDGREAVAQLGELARRADLGARAAEVAQRFAAGAERIHQQLSPWYGR